MINSFVPRTIILYPLGKDVAEVNVLIPVRPIRIRSGVTSGRHKIIVANERNTINNSLPNYQLNSHQTVHLVSAGNTWY